MTPSMEKDAIETAKVAFEKYSDEIEAAQYITETLDEKHGYGWNCIIGNSYSNVKNINGTLVQFQLAGVR